MCICFILWVTVQYRLISLLKLSQLWSLGAAVSLRPAHLLVFSPLPFWVYKKHRLLLYFLCPALQSAIPPGALVYLGCVHFRKCNPGIWNGSWWHHSGFRAFLTGSTGPRTLGHLRHVPPHVTCPLSSPNIHDSYSSFCGHYCWSQHDF